MKTGIIYTALGLAGLLALPAAATPQPQASTAMVFAIDASSSVSAEEKTVQIEAHAALLRSPEFIGKALSDNRCLGVLYLEWSGLGEARTLLPWTLLCSAETATETAAALEKAAAASVPSLRPRSSLSSAIDSARAAMRDMPFPARRKIISISTDGTSNDGAEPALSRDRAAEEGYLITAIGMNKAELGVNDNLRVYLRQNVTIGDGSFAVAAETLDQYPQLLLQRGLLEIRAQERRRVNRWH